MEGTRSGRPARPPSPKIRGCSSGSAARNGKAGGRGDASAEPHPTASVDGPSGRGSGVVGYNVQVAVDTKHHLIVAHEVMNSGSDRAQVITFGLQRAAGPYGKKRDI